MTTRPQNKTVDLPSDVSKIEVRHALEGESIDFQNERDKGTESWRRADGLGALIERGSRAGWLVTLPDGAAPHKVALVRHGDEWFGQCDCDGFRYHDGPCAHLCSVRKASFLNATTTEDETVLPLNVATDAGRANVQEDRQHNVERDQPGTIYGRRCGVGSQRARGPARDRLVVGPTGGPTTRCVFLRRLANHDVITRTRRDYSQGGFQ